MPPTFTQDILIAALAGMKLQQQQLQEKIAHVQVMLDEGTTVKRADTPDTPSVPRRRRSAAVRRRMAEAQKARWEKIKGESGPAAESPSPEHGKAKRKLSAAGRKAIVAALKKRWAEKKAAVKAKPVAPKKKASKAAKQSATPKKAVKKTAAKRAKKAVTKTAAATAPVDVVATA